MGKKPKYNTDTLKFVAERDHGNIIGNYDKISRNTKIIFKCNCGSEFSKTIICIVEYGGLFCKECTRVHKNERSVETNIKRYGTNYAVQNIEIKKKRKLLLLNKYNVENISQLDDVKNKKKIASNIKYGVDYPLQHNKVKEKREETNIERYGVKNQFQIDNIKEKIIKTNLEKYGVEHVSQSQEIQEKIQKNSKKFKLYKMPSGIERKVQGYEPFALDILIQTYNEEKIKTDRKDVPRIKYIVNEKNKYYFPDIFIPHENKIIEVKSTWTYKCKTDNINQKKEACIAQGYNYEIWCFNDKGEIIDLDNIN